MMWYLTPSDFMRWLWFSNYDYLSMYRWLIGWCFWLLSFATSLCISAVFIAIQLLIVILGQNRRFDVIRIFLDITWQKLHWKKVLCCQRIFCNWTTIDCNYHYSANLLNLMCLYYIWIKPRLLWFVVWKVCYKVVQWTYLSFECICRCCVSESSIMVIEMRVDVSFCFRYFWSRTVCSM